MPAIGTAMKIGWIERCPEGRAPIYFWDSYQALFSLDQGLERRVMQVQHSGGCWQLPILLRQLSPGRYEASSAYGYGGLWPSGGDLPDGFFTAIQKFFQREGIICAFIRHSPFIMNHTLFPEDASLFNRTCYVRDLVAGQDLSGFCAKVDQKLRWSINFARRNGLSVTFQPGASWDKSDVRAFAGIYGRLMEKKETNPYYCFSEAFFLQHGVALGDHCELALVRNGPSGEIVAAAFFLLDDAGGWVHYHLSAAEPAFLKLQPMELLLSEAAVRYGAAGFQGLHFGGGHAADGCDGLSRFKRKFSTRTCPFHISTWILDQAAYDEERGRDPLVNPGFFLISAARGQY